MPDAPDYFKYRLDSERNVLGDMAELAVRLKSPVTYDRMGDVVWMEDFATGVGRWRTSLGGTGSYVKVDASYAYWSGFCAKLFAAGVVGGAVSLYKYLSPPRVNKWGIEVSAAFASAFDHFDVEMQHVDADGIRVAGVRINYVTQNLEYYGDDAAYHVIGALAEQTSLYGLYHHLKMVADFDSLEYVKLRQDENLFDLAGVPFFFLASPTPPSSQVYISLRSDGVDGATARVGSVIVTANEP